MSRSSTAALAAWPDRLQAEAIHAALPLRWRADTRVCVLDCVASTNTALREAPPPAGVTVLLAERQSAGRGRQGRSWTSAPGNLALSLATVLPGPVAACAGLALVVGVATAEALHALGFAAVRLKWPNDLVVANDDTLRKLGGLLVEVDSLPGQRLHAVLGLGLNLRMPADALAALDQPCTELAALGALPPRNALVAVLVAQWREALVQFAATGLAPFLPRFEALHALADRTVRVGEGGTAWDGRVCGLAADGALQLRTADGGVHTLHAGELRVRARCAAG